MTIENTHCTAASDKMLADPLRPQGQVFVNFGHGFCATPSGTGDVWLYRTRERAESAELVCCLSPAALDTLRALAAIRDRGR